MTQRDPDFLSPCDSSRNRDKREGLEAVSLGTTFCMESESIKCLHTHDMHTIVSLCFLSLA